jgi:hypothetical protein
VVDAPGLKGLSTLSFSWNVPPKVQNLRLAKKLETSKEVRLINWEHSARGERGLSGIQFLGGLRRWRLKALQLRENFKPLERGWFANFATFFGQRHRGLKPLPTE